jgi:hypothetical protein
MSQNSESACSDAEVDAVTEGYRSRIGVAESALDAARSQYQRALAAWANANETHRDSLRGAHRWYTESLYAALVRPEADTGRRSRTEARSFPDVRGLSAAILAMS